MICPFCKSNLINQGPYGFLASHQSGEVLGHTYKCPASEGFEDEASALAYLESTGQTMEDVGATMWEDVTCDSSVHSVCGSFYTDKQDNLHEGYPC